MVLLTECVICVRRQSIKTYGLNFRHRQGDVKQTHDSKKTADVIRTRVMKTDASQTADVIRTLVTKTDANKTADAIRARVTTPDWSKASGKERVIDTGGLNRSEGFRLLNDLVKEGRLDFRRVAR